MYDRDTIDGLNQLLGWVSAQTKDWGKGEKETLVDLLERLISAKKRLLQLDMENSELRAKILSLEKEIATLNAKRNLEFGKSERDIS
jgi:cell division protein FtsB